MTMPYLYKQNRLQWIALIILFMVFLIEYQFRIDMQAKNADKIYLLESRMKNTEQCLIDFPYTNEIMPSCLILHTVTPKHKNHER